MKQDDVLKNLNVYAFLNNVDPPVEESREATFSIKKLPRHLRCLNLMIYRPVKSNETILEADMSEISANRFVKRNRSARERSN